MRLYAGPAAGGEAHCLTESVGGVSSYAWSPDGGRIAFVAPDPGRKRDPLVVGKFGYGINLDLQFWLVDLAFGTVRQLTFGEHRFSNGDASHPPFAWGPRGDRLLISFTDDAHMHLFTSKISSLDLTDGSFRELAAPHGTFSDLKVSPDGTMLAFRGARQDEPQPMDVYLMPVSGGPLRNLTAAEIDRQIKCYSWQKDGSLIVLAEDGLASTFYRCHQEGRCQRLPGFDVHVSSHYWKSQTFVARPYGGFMSAWAVTQTNRFKAAVAGAAIMDQALLTGATDSWVMYYDMWYKGIAYEDPEHYRDRSPLTHVKNVKTPTLILSNASDTDVVLAQGIQFHRPLRYLGVETQLVVFPREPHSSPHE